MIITNSNQLHYHLYEFMEDKMCFRKLKSMILLHKLKKKKNIENFGSFSARFRPIFDFELKGKRSRAERGRAENPSARALTRASSARTHH